MRKAFETWLTGRVSGVTGRNPDLSTSFGEYVNSDHQRRWEAWHAAQMGFDALLAERDRLAAENARLRYALEDLYALVRKQGMDDVFRARIESALAKRYTQPCVQTQPGPEFKVAEVPLFESPKGKYVLASDYEALQAELVKARRENVALLAERDRLATENRQLRAAQLQDWSSEGHKDYRIEALEASLDWAMVAVLEHYESGDAPDTAGAFKEIEQSIARIKEFCRADLRAALTNASQPTKDET
jgi:hypothetical protein